jgi:HK97 family phage prohead protease
VPELVRTWQGELRVRAAGDPESRTIEGTVIPFGQVIHVQDSPTGPRYRETIAPGAVDGIDASRITLESLPRPGQAYNTHEGSVLVGRAVAAESDGQALRMAFRVSRTAAGDELLELARDGVLAQLSASFMPIEQRTRADGVVERTRIDVRRVAVVERGAYDAPITAVRAAQEGSNMPPTNPAAAAPADATTDESTDEQPATPAVAGDRPNRTRVTVDVERAAAERETVAELSRGASGPRGGLPGITITRAERVYGPRAGHSFLADGWLARQGNAEAAERQAPPPGAAGRRRRRARARRMPGTEIGTTATG